MLARATLFALLCATSVVVGTASLAGVHGLLHEENAASEVTNDGGASRRLLEVPTATPTNIPTPGPTAVVPAQRSTQSMGKQDATTSFQMAADEGLLSLTSTSSSVTEGPPLTVPLCGNGIRQGQEQCDDGNLVDGDGCSRLCLVEPSFACNLKQVTDS